ncbi:MAG: hypothetical protein KatS3mg027_0901 [Bacteroidia bacterium]|nr:MAG: hypothetical protein KatS3mg027_0901 [Bacteroidia bacterium]
MKKSTFIIGIIYGSIHLSIAQTTIDTVSVGSGYANEKWYSLENDEQGSSPKNNWDIAFETSGMGSAIHINSVIGTKLWLYPNGDTSAWNSIDTSGINTWVPRYNSDTSWSVGAFNVGATSNPYDLGWGIYNSITHEVIGDSLFIIKLSNNQYKKLWIKKLSSGVYYFQYADLNGNNLQNESIAKASYNTKTLVYYSIQNNMILDREPVSANWDLVFKQYTAFIPSPYTVAGVLQNKGVSAIKVHPVDTSYNQWFNHTWNTAINTIGYNWKNYTGSWQIEDSLVYFVKSKQGDVWKLIFTGFGGSGNGNYIFKKQKISPTSVASYVSEMPEIILYPVPAKNYLNILLNQKNQKIQEVVIDIMDLSGKNLIHKKWTNVQPFDNQSINVEDLPSGVYIISISGENFKTTQKFIKQN